MMGIDDMAVSFAISVGAGYVPNIISLIKGDVTLNDKIDKCFKKALDKWDVSNETRQVMRYHM